MKDELIKLLVSNQVILVHGETGSGKTTQIGQFLLDGPSDSPPRVVSAPDLLVFIVLKLYCTCFYIDMSKIHTVYCIQLNIYIVSSKPI